MREVLTYQDEERKFWISLIKDEFKWLIDLGVDTSASGEMTTLTLPSGWRSETISTNGSSPPTVRYCFNQLGQPRILLTEAKSAIRQSRYPKLIGFELLRRFVIESENDDPQVRGLILDRVTGQPVLLMRKTTGAISAEEREETRADLTQWLQERYPDYLDPTAYWNEDMPYVNPTVRNDQLN
ncbi:hypothetical protein COY93_04370 [Candidatus Uhrbacteria bacterium CG_4_10_14_0_8_um_filter_58_22]|uniref:Uncharacterized protein n=1 Tax=Candidatus Uhrbacteria bacterium CG_4_10_14_0_8_um_filter_58_22 TaxID=1975029 RepID=A0A2M7Q9Q1_9BACT|nr:MAG: hypothetical protein AUJ19_02230 [Parcubacteria group bacterium CG1_02_58_44]PIY61951.1 MAG: hypothetical protein COY93_04370 [Candidatus Uhrbacteria bacterium CG_4_10_14_0_8_um_filter_58_22]